MSDGELNRPRTGRIWRGRTSSERADEHRTEVLHILDRLSVPDLPEVDHGVWHYLLHNS